MIQSMPFVVVRLLVDADPLHAAQVLAAAQRAVGARSHHAAVEPYDKEPGWHEVSFRVDDTLSSVRAALAPMIARAPWTEGGDAENPWAVCSPTTGAVRFVNLEGVPEDN